MISTATNMPVDNDVDPLMHGAAGLEILAELDERLTERDLSGRRKARTQRHRPPSGGAVVRRGRARMVHDFGPRRLREWLATLMASNLFEQAMVVVKLWAETRT
jgi:hypothetical protein